MDKQLAVLEQWRKWQKAQGLSERTIGARHATMTHFFALTAASADGITPEQIIAFVGREGLSQSSRYTYHRAIRAYSRWMVKTGRREDDPSEATPAPRQPKGVPRPVRGDELPRILKAANRRRTRMMILLASLQGLRIHEIAKIRGEDIDIYGMTLTVKGKGGKESMLPLHETVALFARNFPVRGWWFPSYVLEGPVTPGSVGNAIRKTMRRAGVEQRPHSLRHYFGTTLVQNGVDLRTVQELLRHESLATTQIYTQVADKQKRAAISTLQITA